MVYINYYSFKLLTILYYIAIYASEFRSSISPSVSSCSEVTLKKTELCLFHFFLQQVDYGLIHLESVQLAFYQLVVFAASS